MGQFDSIYKCTLGGADFQLSKLKESNQSVRDSGRETARSITLAGEGWLEGTSGADLAAKIAALRTATNTRGQDFTVTGLGGATYCQVLAAQCLNGGPHVDFEIEDSDTPLVQTIRFSVAAMQSSPPLQNPPAFPAHENTRKLSVEAGPDELRTIGIEASVSGPGSERFFLDVVAANLQAQYPWPAWVLKYKYEINLNDDKLDYTVTAKEMAESLPGVGNRARVVDGDLIEQSERDGERLLWTTSCDFLIEGNPQDVVDATRPANATLIKESVEISFHQEVRLRASFTELRSVDGTGLLEWEGSLEPEREDALVRAVGYDGMKVDLVYDSVPWRLTVTGRAVGIGKWPKEVLISPPKGYVADAYVKPKLRRVNAYERETTWSQSFLGTRGLGDEEINVLKTSLSRPTRPVFYS